MGEYGNKDTDTVNDSSGYSYNITDLCNVTMADFIANGTNNDNFMCNVYSEPFSPPYIQTVMYVFYCSILLLALFGNGLVCYVVQSSPRMRTVTNYFIVNLAVGDLLMAVLCIPFTFVSTLLLQYWPFGQELCQIVSFSQVHFPKASSKSILSLDTNAFYKIIYYIINSKSLKKHITHLRIKLEIDQTKAFTILLSL